MSDKMRRTFPVNVTLVDGERPAPEKLTAIATQARNGLGIIEEAVGDILNQAGDEYLSDVAEHRRLLKVPSVGRMIGVSDALSPHLDPIDDDFEFYDDTSPAFDDLLTMPLTFIATGSLEDVPGATNPETDTLDVNSTGEWYHSVETNKIFSWDSVDNLIEIKYTADATHFPTHPDTFNLTPNVIPPPAQSVGFTGCKVVSKGVAGYYYIILPPRQRLSAREDLDWLPLNASNEGISGATANLFWDSTTAYTDAPALADAYSAHYRYRLPTMLDGLSAGDVIPDGVIKIFIDEQAADGVVAYRPAGASGYDYSFIIEVYAPYDTTALDVAAALAGAAVHSTAAYATGVRVVTSGSSIAETVAQNRLMILNHAHTSASASKMSARVSHDDLVDLDPPDASTLDYIYGDGNEGFYPWDDAEVKLLKSNWRNDGHLQYVHRAGSLASGDALWYRDVYNNAFLGDLLIGSTLKSTAPFYNNVAADSQRIYFGKIGSGPYCYFDQGNGDLEFHTDVGNGNGLSAFITNSSSLGNAVYAESNSTWAPGSLFVNTAGSGGIAIQGECSEGTGVRGEGTTGVGVYGDATTGVGVYGDASTGNGVHGTTESGIGVYGKSTVLGTAVHGNGDAGGYGVVAEGLLNPTAGGYAAFRVVPQSGAPLNKQQGDIYTDGGGHIWCYLGAVWKQLDN